MSNKVVSVLVDDSSIEKNSSGQLRVKDLGVSEAKIANGAVTDAKAANTIVKYADLLSGCKAYLSVAQTIPTGAVTKIAFDNEEFDLAGEFDLVNHRFTATKAGYYLITASIMWSITVDGANYRMFIEKSGTSIGASNMTSGSAQSVCCPLSVITYLAIGDYIELSGYHTSGVNADAYHTAANTFLCIKRIG